MIIDNSNVIPLTFGDHNIKITEYFAAPPPDETQLFEISTIGDPKSFDIQPMRRETTFFHPAYPKDCKTNHGNVKCFKCAQVQKMMRLFNV